MPMYDLKCLTCGVEGERYLPLITTANPVCQVCGGFTKRMTLEHQRKTGAVIGDDIPGGTLVEHGICHEDGSPKRYYSKTEIRRACAERGITWGYDTNRHVPTKGSDKSPHTRKW